MSDEKQPTQPTQPTGIDPKTGKPYEPVQIPVPTRDQWLKDMRKVAPPVKPEPPADDKADDSDGHAGRTRR